MVTVLSTAIERRIKPMVTFKMKILRFSFLTTVINSFVKLKGAGRYHYQMTSWNEVVFWLDHSIG